MEAISEIQSPQVRFKKIPSYLIYEEMDGKPIYYRGFEAVLKKKVNPESVMGSSIIQSLVITSIVYFLKSQNIIKKNFFVASNEAGLLLGRGSTLNSDIVLYEKNTVKDVFSNKYADFPPKIVIEIDTKADMADFTSIDEYYHKKTQKLLDFGVEKVIWIFTGSKKILSATIQSPWLIYNWDDTINVMEDCNFCINDLLKEEGIL